MSGIAGIYNLDGEPVDPALLRRMTDAIAHRGPDGIRHWVEGPVGLGHCMLHTTPESVYEKQPLTDESGDLCLTMDGRVDNRAELRTALESAGVRLRDDTDAELVLKTYQCWREECPLKILGDFAFAIWDRERRQLLCARDALGHKPFYYHWDGCRFFWASELHQIFEAAEVSREPNEGMIGEYLAVHITHTEETLYTSVLRLPPAHSLLARCGRITTHRYWDVDPEKQIRHRNDGEYAEHFTAVFKEAVHSCLRSNTPVGSHLSGGLDSSSVVCMAQAIFCQGLATGRGFETFSMLFPGLPADESDYIRPVVERWNLTANYLCLEDPPPGWLERQVHFYRDICDYPNGTQSDPLRALAREKGFRVLLTGHGGDERFSGSLYYLADLVRQCKGRSLFRELREQNLRLLSRSGSSAIARYAVLPLLPSFAQRVIRGLRRQLVRRRTSLSWINPSFARRINLPERLRQSMFPRPHLHPSKRRPYFLLKFGGGVHGMEMEERSSSWFSQEQRHPFRDRRLVEFSFALPENQSFRRDQKFILRQVMSGYLPEAVRQRRHKVDFTHVLVRTVRGLGGEHLFERLYLDRLGLVDGNRVRVMYKEMMRLYDAGNDGFVHHIWPLWMVYAVELWLEKLVSSRGTSEAGCPDDALIVPETA